MLRVIFVVVVLGAAAAVSGCATIVHSGPRTIPIASTPTGAKVSIYDRSDSLVMVNTTPFVASLNTKFGYFKSQEYRLVFEMPGYNRAEINLNSSVSGWYFGNLLFGGVIGMLIVDPLTGAMYNLTPEKIEQHMSASQAQIIRSGQGLVIVLASQVTQRERDDMVRVN
jgi:drug/metabolite transporter (DMT)-like permease